MEKAVRYLRVSTDQQDENNQISAIDKYCEERDWKIVDTYRDHGVSAYKDDTKREEFQKMLKDAETSDWTHIVVFDLDRFSRQDEDVVIRQIKKLRLLHNVEVNAVYGDEWKDAIDIINKLPDMGFIGEALADFIEKLMLGMQARRNRLESEKISRRVTHSTKFKKAKKEQRVGRPKIPPIIILMAKELMGYYDNYEDYKYQLGYKHKRKEKYPGEAYISLIRTGTLDVKEIEGKHVLIDRRKINN